MYSLKVEAKEEDSTTFLLYSVICNDGSLKWFIGIHHDYKSVYFET